MSQKIKLITFKSAEETIIGFVESYKPRDSNEVANEKTPAKSMDLPRHADFERAMDKLKPHLVIATDFVEPLDNVDNILTKEDFNEFFADKPNVPLAFQGLTVTGILIQGKNAADGVQIFGTKTTRSGDVIKIKTGSIALKRVADGYNYPLIEILDEQIDFLLSEADKYHSRKKHGAGVQTEMQIAV